jgi:hypothetical protein
MAPTAVTPSPGFISIAVSDAAELGVVDVSGTKILSPDEVRQLRDEAAQWKRIEAETLSEVIKPPTSALIPNAVAAPSGEAGSEPAWS